jgi:hypothetical protein
LCSIRFGCCLARARNLVDLYNCLRFYWRCLRECFRPLTCNLSDPHDCVEEQEFPIVGVLRGVEIRGTAAGASCSHYTIDWRPNGIGPWKTAGVHYPGNAPQGPCGIVNGTLGYLATFPFVAPGLVETDMGVRLARAITRNRELEDLRSLDAPLQLMHPSEDAECFVRDGSLTCIRPVLDFEKQKPMLLATSTGRLWGSGAASRFGRAQVLDVADRARLDVRHPIAHPFQLIELVRVEDDRDAALLEVGQDVVGDSRHPPRDAGMDREVSPFHQR